MAGEQDIFDTLTEHAKEFAEDPLIEHALQVIPSQGVVVAGVQIEAREFHAPLFLSAQDLRDMADEAEKRTKAILANQK